MWGALLPAWGVPRAVCHKGSGGSVRVVFWAGPPRESQVGGSVRFVLLMRGCLQGNARLRPTRSLLRENRRLEIRGIPGGSEGAAEEPNAEGLGEIERGPLVFAPFSGGWTPEGSCELHPLAAGPAQQSAHACSAGVSSNPSRKSGRLPCTLPCLSRFCLDSGGQALLFCSSRVESLAQWQPELADKGGPNAGASCMAKGPVGALVAPAGNGHVLQGVHSSPKESGACVIVLRR